LKTSHPSLCLQLPIDRVRELHCEFLKVVDEGLTSFVDLFYGRSQLQNADRPAKAAGQLSGEPSSEVMA